MARKFGIGYSPDSYDALFRHLQEKGFKVSEILKTGLVLENKDGKGYHDRFRGRLMSPFLMCRGVWSASAAGYLPRVSRNI